MEPFDVSPELRFREESIKRVLQEFHKNGNVDGLMDAAAMLNQLWHQQIAIARWFADEAQNNLGEAWEAHHRASVLGSKLASQSSSSSRLEVPTGSFRSFLRAFWQRVMALLFLA